jgi:hypothetical protein
MMDSKLVVETVMRTGVWKQLLGRLMRIWHAPKAISSPTRAPAPVVDFDPFWHGDHWQNLLASPMDARHYVMEDWSLPTADDRIARQAGAAKNRRTRR